MKDDLFRYPTYAEMRALEAAAHRARALEMARLLRAGARALKSLVLRLSALPVGKRVSHA
jgi:hypothetical protein